MLVIASNPARNVDRSFVTFCAIKDRDRSASPYTCGHDWHSVRRPCEPYFTAIVTPACDCVPPMVRVIGTTEPVATPCGTTAFTCNSPAIESGADPAYCGATAIPPIVTVFGKTGMFNPDPGTLPFTPAGDVCPSPIP